MVFKCCWQYHRRKVGAKFGGDGKHFRRKITEFMSKISDDLFFFLVIDRILYFLCFCLSLGCYNVFTVSNLINTCTIYGPFFMRKASVSDNKNSQKSYVTPF